MNDMSMPGAYGVMTEPTTLRIERLLPGPIERVWSYLTDGDLRRKWLAAGKMDLKAGSAFTFTWRNSDLGTSPGSRPEGMAEEHSMTSTILAVDAPRKLVFTWGEKAEVQWDLEPQGKKVLFTITHRRITDRKVLLSVSAGWHAHLDTLVAVVAQQGAEPFWDRWASLRPEYEKRLPE